MSKLLRLENLTFIGAGLGLAVGLFLPGIAGYFSLFGDLFTTLLKMTIVPLILFSVFVAVAKQAGHGQLSKIGLKTFLYFLGTTALAGITGFLASQILDGRAAGAQAQGYDASKLASTSLDKVILGFFPSNPFRALSEGDIIQIVVFALILGVASVYLDSRKRSAIIEVTDAIQDLIMITIGKIIWLAPIGVFALVANVIANTQLSSFSGLDSFFLAVGVAALVHSLLLLPLVAFVFGGFNPYKFIFNVREPLLVSLATASSSATLPVSTRVMEENEKVHPETAGFVLPLGATLNMNGSALYQALLVLYLGQVVGIDFTLGQQIQIFVFVLLSSAGTAGIPSGGMVMMGAMFQMTGIPLEMLGFYLLVDRFWDPIVTMINVLGDLFGAKIIDRQLRRSS